jgi:hypothetical protein
MKATVTTHYADAWIARSIETALKADNQAAPRPLHVTSRATEKRVVSTVAGARDVESLLATVDDLLLCLIAVDGLASTTKCRKPRARKKR